MRRFTIAPDHIARGHVDFDADESRHLSRVLRLRPGDTVIASDGAGHDYTVRLDTVGAHTSGSILRVAAHDAESPLAVTLVQVVAKGDRMEMIVRAVTELGVARVLPALGTRTVVRLDTAGWRERTRRWQRVAREASKQCRRGVVPDVQEPQPLADRLSLAAASDVALCLWEGDGLPLERALASAVAPRTAVLLIGPEGGLADDEVAAARTHGWTIVSLGRRILRTETAGPAMLAVLQARFGDLGRAST
jgi:16S rRNA (uracil1498-N3)-methyltransferase